MAETDYNRTIVGAIPSQLSADIFADATIGALFDFIKTLNGDDYVFQFSRELTVPEEAQLDSVIASYTPLPIAAEEKVVLLSSGMDGIYSHSTSILTQVKFNVLTPSFDSILPGSTKVFAKIVADINIEGTADAQIDLFCYTDYIAVEGSTLDVPNQTWGGVESTDWFEIDNLKAFRVRTKRVGGGASNDVSIEGFTLLVKYIKYA